ncbi:protein of unknown function DUF721 [Denitrovibrio acetiphilus DSM 12809]|uniref:DUF721 domain-containing protein n=1 Tax=Denitrovibrio acetiphilus (strain DSM 12809 / NBRC 114555 / N2460) TaxID=522772 RepID=D4H188_DENA2|nr:DciA family protein [Denitrovibrio acetiphilus]ADD66836.1 protein of unknown function DUF721 [Denitrovibrio acetiphilus DSM 12809]
MKKLSEILPGSIPGNFQSYLKTKKVWNDCAGDSIAFLTTVGSTKDGVLNVAVHDQTWLSEIGFLKGELISRLNQQGLEISNINFFYKAKKQSEAAKAIHKRKEMSEKEKKFADKLIETVENEDLRNSLRKAIYAYFTVYTLDDYLNC